MITKLFLLFFEFMGAALGFLVYAAMDEFNKSVTSAMFDGLTPYKRDNFVAAQRSHEIASSALMVWNIICMLAFAFTLIAIL